MADINYDIAKEITVLSENSKVWKKDFNVISWNSLTPKYDIRDGNPENEKRYNFDKRESFEAEGALKYNFLSESRHCRPVLWRWLLRT